MSKFLATGCSFTFFKWRTWADYIAEDFDNSLNKGIPGADNPTIARITVAMAEPGDTVCVMWSSYQRHNYKINFESTYNYSRAHWGVTNLQDKYYTVNIFNHYERFLTTLDYIEFVNADSINRKYKVIHLSAFPLLGGEINTPISSDMQSKLKEKQYFVDLVNKNDLFTFNQPYYIPGEDPHPTEFVHQKFADAVVKKLL